MRTLALLAFALLLAPSLARADDDELSSTPTTSSHEDDPSAPTPKKKHPKHAKSDDADDELATEKTAPEKLARLDDPRVGLGVELTLSLALIDKSSGPGSTGAGAGGIRFNWAPGFLFTNPEDEFWRYALLAELSYDYTSLKGGTALVSERTALHYLNFHAMLGYPAQKLLLLYAALGPGVTFEHVDYDVGGTTTPLTGTKFNLAYGLGARLNLQVNEHFAIVSRVELLRYQRGYMDDTFLTFSAGGAF